MDSTLISTRPDEGTLSLSRAVMSCVRALLVLLSTGMIFYSMASPPHWCLIASFSRK